MSCISDKIRLLGVTCLLLISAVFIAGCFSENDNPQAKQPLLSAQLLPATKPLIKFSLESQRGEEWTADNFKSHWNLVFFGFTLCPDLCPMELHELTGLLKLASQVPGMDVRVIFISLDPERDSKEKMADYLAAFNEQIIGLRGDNTELAKVSHFFAADYSRSARLDSDASTNAGAALNIPAGIDMPPHAEGSYQVEHSPRIYIVDPMANYIGSFAPPFKAGLLWSELQVIIKR
ncbi:MAG TPA: SCO family protein [Cellvibrio sp.]|nr:SCO family protein [Cellvibrio sp.]